MLVLLLKRCVVQNANYLLLCIRYLAISLCELFLCDSQRALVLFLTGANCDGANLRGAQLAHSNLTGATLNAADLTSADLSNTNLYGASFVGTDLSKANLENSNLTYATFNGATLVVRNFEVSINEQLWCFNTVTRVRNVRFIDVLFLRFNCEPGGRTLKERELMRPLLDLHGRKLMLLKQY